MKTSKLSHRRQCRYIYLLALIAILLLGDGKSTKRVAGQMDAISAVMSVVPVASILTTAGLVGVKLAALSKLLDMMGINHASLGNAPSPPTTGQRPDYVYTLPVHLPGLNIQVSQQGSFKHQEMGGNRRPQSSQSSQGSQAPRRKVYPAMIVPADYESIKRPFQGMAELREIFERAGLSMIQSKERPNSIVIVKPQALQQEQQQPQTDTTAHHQTDITPHLSAVPLSFHLPPSLPSTMAQEEQQPLQVVTQRPALEVVDPPETRRPDAKPELPPLAQHQVDQRQNVGQDLSNQQPQHTNQQQVANENQGPTIQPHLHRPVIPPAFHRFQQQPPLPAQIQPSAPQMQPPTPQMQPPAPQMQPPAPQPQPTVSQMQPPERHANYIRRPMFPHPHHPPQRPLQHSHSFANQHGPALITGSLTNSEEFPNRNDPDDETHFFDDYDRISSFQRMKRSLASIILQDKLNRDLVGAH